jgi:hypothetical protein
MNKPSSPNKPTTQAALPADKRMAVYAWVSTQEQTKGDRLPENWSSRKVKLSTLFVSN